MADELEDYSDGSDIEVDFDEQEAFIDGIFGDINEEDARRAQEDWLHGFFDSDSDDEEFHGFDNDWKTGDFTSRTTRPYNDIGGSTYQHPEEAQPEHYFDLLWGDDMWDHIVTQTNRYADQQRTRNPPPQYAPKWLPVDIPIMKAFVGLCFLMGVMRLPSRSDYWRMKKRMLRTAFNSIMSRDRFDLIWRYLHLSDNEAPAPAQPDRLRKIRWFLDNLNMKFRTMYVPYGNMTIDESMVKFKGRLSFRQYLPSKPIKWGVKVWTLAESTTGYIHQFQVYTGKEGNQGKGLSHRVVTDLLLHVQHKNICVFMDNFFSSPTLFLDLKMRGINACGTVRSNRKGLPTALLPRNVLLDKHACKVAQKDDLTCCVWQDTKPVLFLSNFHDPETVSTVNRRAGNPVQQPVGVPKMVGDYQKFMKGVDLADQMLGYYMIHHRSRKWWRRLFFHFMMASAHNAYVLAKDTNPDICHREWPNFQDFVEELAEGLIGDTRAGKDAPVMHEPRAARRHDMVKLYEKEKVCAECRARATRGERVGASRFGCVQCNLPVHTQCFPAHISRANNL